MADDTLDLHLDRFWDGLVRGDLRVSAEGLDPDEPAAVRAFQRLTDAPLPAHVRAADWRALRSRIETHRQTEEAIMENITQWQPMPNAFGRNGRYGPAGPPVRAEPRRGSIRWFSLQFATALLLVMTLAAGLLTYRGMQDHAAIPALDATPIPATPAPAQPSGWLQFRGDSARTGVAPGPGPQGQPVQLWKVHPTGDVGHDEISDPPVIADGVMYIGTGRGFLALNVADGSELWRVQGYGGGPVVEGDGLIVRTETGNSDGLDLARIRRSDGGLVWKAEAGQQRVTWYPDLVGGTVYIPSEPNDLIAVNAATGAVTWRAKLNSPASRSAAVSNGVAYVGGDDGTMYAIETTSGDILWTTPTDATTLGVPSVVAGTVYVSSKDGASNPYYAFDAATGALKWKFVTPSGSGFYYAAVDGSTVYVPSEDGVLYALDAASGALKWKFQTGAQLQAMPVLVGDTVYQSGGDGFQYAIDAATGKEVWRFAIDGPSQFSPVIVDGVLYVTTFTGTIYAIGGLEQSSTASPAAESPTAVTSPTVAATASGEVATFVQAFTGDVTPIVKPGDIAVDAAGNLWIADGGNSRVLIYDPRGNLTKAWGTPGSDPGEFNFVRANGEGWGSIGFDAAGNVYVADTGNFRIEKFGPDRTFLTSWGTNGKGDGQFEDPIALAVTPAGIVYVIDDSRLDVQMFGPDGTFLGKFGTTGHDPGQFGFQLLLLSVDPSGNVWVADNGRGIIHEFDADGNFIADLGSKGFDDGLFDQPADIAFDNAGHVFVSDNNRVQVFDTSGTFLAKWGGFGTGDGQLNGGGGMALDTNGNLYVVDYFNNRVQKFHLNRSLATPAAATVASTVPGAPAEFVTAITGEGDHAISQPGNIRLAPDGNLWVPNGDGRILIFTTDGSFGEAWGAPGSGDGQFNFDTFGDVAFGRDGSIYVLDTGNHRIQKFDRHRQFVKAFGSFGSGDGQLMRPISLEIGADGALLVADNDGNRIARFWPDGSWAGAIGAPGSGPGQLLQPIEVVVDSEGRIWVTEGGNGRISIFDSDGTFLSSFGSHGTGQGQFNIPANLALDGNGHVFVSDGTRIVVTDEQGTYLTEWGTKGSGEGQFSSSGGIELDGEGNLYVMDFDNNRIQVFHLLPPLA